METTDIKKIKGKLLAEKDRLERELAKVAKKKGKKFAPVYPEYGSKDEENAAEITAYTLNLALDKNIEKLLGSVVVALHRIEAKSYGQCAFCDIDINPERLEAYPSAIYCIDCQTKMDHPLKKFFLKLKKFKKNKK